MKNNFHHRDQWAARRRQLEKSVRKQNARFGTGNLHRAVAGWLARGLKYTPLYEQGLHNAICPRLVSQTFWFEHLPQAFDGFTLLHLTDLHLDSHPDLLPNTLRVISEACQQGPVDLCLMTGDYALNFGLDRSGVILEAMAQLFSALKATDGVFAVLGNHDSQAMAAPFERMGIKMLINEHHTLSRQGQTITLTGLDDPYEYHTVQAEAALKETVPGFRIAMIHTPELYKEARAAGVDLYLTGHTHGGQICLPGGIPLVLNLKKGHRFFKGKWQYRGMQGYTGQGLGTVGIPIRFNTVSEITRIELRSGKGEKR